MAAASFVNNFFNLAFIFGIGFSYGLTPIIGGMFARKEYSKAGETVKNSLVINLLTGIALSLIMLFLMFNIHLLDQPEELMPLILPYYTLQLFSVIFTMLFNSFKQFNDGITDTLTPMWVMLGCNVLNILGNYMLIYGNWGAPELGLSGAGISTLGSRMAGLAAISFLFYYKPRYQTYREGFRKGKISRINIAGLVRLGFPIGLQMGVETASFSLSVIMMGWIGEAALAAHQILCVFTTIGFMIYYGIGAAVTIRVSGYRRFGDWDNIRHASFAGLHIILANVMVVMLLILILRSHIGYLFTPDIEIASLVALLCLPAIIYQPGDALQILFANALRGIGDVKYMALMAFVCHFGLALPIGYVCAFPLGLGAFGIWCGFPISLTVLGVLLYKRFNKLTLSFTG